MRILFNKDEQGTTELMELTSAYYQNNSFAKIKTDLLLETELLIKLIGPDVYKLAEDWYYNVEGAADHSDLAQHIQLPIAYAASFNFYQNNIVSHEDNGRKLKINKSDEATPWEWMLDRDDQATQTKIFRGIDRLIEFLDRSNLTEWKDSAAQKASRKLFINTTETFHNTYPIDHSGRFYHALVPFITSIENKIIKKALGTELYTELLTWHQSISSDDPPVEPTEGNLDKTMLLALIRECVPLLAMLVAIDRFQLNIMPYGVVQKFQSMMQTANATQVALKETMRDYSLSLKKAADEALDELKQYVDADNVGLVEYDLLPKNDPCNKYFRT